MSALNLLKLAPGGHLGRFAIWTEAAFRRLDEIYGTWRKPSDEKKGFTLPMPKMTNQDLARILKSDEVQSALCPRRKENERRHLKKNPIKNIRVMAKLNPYAITKKRKAIVEQERAVKRKVILT